MFEPSHFLSSSTPPRLLRRKTPFCGLSPPSTCQRLHCPRCSLERMRNRPSSSECPGGTPWNHLSVSLPAVLRSYPTKSVVSLRLSPFPQREASRFCTSVLCADCK